MQNKLTGVTAVLFVLLAIPSISAADVHGSTVPVSSPANGACQEGSADCASKSPWEQEYEKIKNAWGACQAEVDKYCEGVQVGEGRIEQCLKDHKKKLSKKCREAQGLK